MSIRGRVADTTYRANVAIADARQTLALAREALGKAEELIAVGKDSADTLKRILARLEEYGAKFGLEVAGHKIPAEVVVEANTKES